MLIDFNTLQEMTFPGMNNGTGTMTAGFETQYCQYRR